MSTVIGTLEEIKAAGVAMRTYRERIKNVGAGLWTPDLGEGFFEGWKAAIDFMESKEGN